MKVSGVNGIFINLQDKLETKPNLFWIKRHELETDENYARRCLHLSKERSQPCILRNGGGSDIGFLKKSSDHIEPSLKVVDAMGFSGRWDEQDVQTLLQAIGWTDTHVLSRKKVFGSFSWRLRGDPPPTEKIELRGLMKSLNAPLTRRPGLCTFSVLHLAPSRHGLNPSKAPNNFLDKTLTLQKSQMAKVKAWPKSSRNNQKTLLKPLRSSMLKILRLTQESPILRTGS